MNEFIEVRFQKNGQRFRVKRQVPGGIEFDERDPIERTVGFQFKGRSEATRQRMRNIARLQGWDPGQFRLSANVEDGSIILRGVNPHALPEGLYELKVQVEEAECSQKSRSVDIELDKHATIAIDVALDDRVVNVNLTDVDPRIDGVLGRSAIDGVPATDWLASSAPRPTKQACLLNLLASLRVRPTLSGPLIDLVRHIFWVGNDRLYAKVDREFLPRLQQLALDNSKPFFAEGKPRAAVHGRLLDSIDASERPRFTEGLLSFRGEGKPSMQTVVAVPPADLPHTYAEFDLDLGNPLQDLLGFIVHMGELLDGKVTNHLDLRKNLVKTGAGNFLYYEVTAAGVARSRATKMAPRALRTRASRSQPAPRRRPRRARA